MPFTGSKKQAKIADDTTVTNSKINIKYIIIFKHQD